MKSAHLLRPRIKSNLHLLLIKVTVHKKHKLTKILKYNTSHTSSLCSQAHARITPKPTMPQQHVSSHRKSFTQIQGEGDCEALLQAHLKGWPQNHIQCIACPTVYGLRPLLLLQSNLDFSIINLQI